MLEVEVMHFILTSVIILIILTTVIILVRIGPVTKASWNGEHFQRWSCTMWSLTLGSKPPRLQRSSQSPWSKPENYIIFNSYFEEWAGRWKIFSCANTL